MQLQLKMGFHDIPCFKINCLKVQLSEQGHKKKLR